MVMHQPVARVTRIADRVLLLTSAIDSDAARPSTGVISGARSMAPITTAAESAESPITATMTDKVSITVKRNAQASTRISARSLITRRRSSGSR